MERAVDQFRNLPTTWLEISQFSDKLKLEILSGEVNPLEVELCLKAMEEVIKKTRGDKYVKEAIQAEAAKFPGKSFQFKGVEVTKSSRTTYDYSGCGDDVYNDLMRQQEDLKARIKAREAMLKTGVNADTGEVYNPPQTSTTEFLTIKYKSE